MLVQCAAGVTIARMQPSSQELQRTFAAMEDAPLLEAARSLDQLTPDAQQVMRAELRRRSMEVPQQVTPEPEPELDMSQLNMVTVRRFRDLSGAIVARGALEAAGIPCILRDAEHVRMDSIMSNMIGGMRLQVREQDAAEAEAALRGYEAASTGDMPLAGPLALELPDAER